MTPDHIPGGTEVTILSGHKKGCVGRVVHSGIQGLGAERVYCIEVDGVKSGPHAERHVRRVNAEGD